PALVELERGEGDVRPDSERPRLERRERGRGRSARGRGRGGGRAAAGLRLLGAGGCHQHEHREQRDVSQPTPSHVLLLPPRSATHRGPPPTLRFLPPESTLRNRRQVRTAPRKKGR